MNEVIAAFMNAMNRPFLTALADRDRTSKVAHEELGARVSDWMIEPSLHVAFWLDGKTLAHRQKQNRWNFGIVQPKQKISYTCQAEHQTWIFNITQPATLGQSAGGLSSKINIICPC